MGKFGKNLGVLLGVLFLLVLAACSSSNISLDKFELNAAGGVDELAIGKTLALTVVIEETDPEDQGQATVEWSINSLATTAINVTEAELANETGRENTLTAKAEGKVEIVVKSEGEERKLEIDIIRDDDGDGFPAGEQDPNDNDPCVPSDEVPACTDTIDNDGDGTSKTTDPNDEDPCDPDDTIQACTDTIDNDGDGTSKTTDPNDEDPCDPDSTVQACTDLAFVFATDPASSYTRVDRMGMPAIATVVITSKDDYNKADPSDDANLDFAGEIVTNVSGLHTALDDDLTNAGLVPCNVDPNDPFNATTSKCITQAAPLVVPDTVTIDTTTAAGFPNGRKLADPVVDVTLAVILLDLSAQGQSATTLANLPLNPTANDKAFLTDFPYLAPPH